MLQWVHVMSSRLELRMDMDIAIPVAEVVVERLFSSGRDTLVTRRHSMKAETMRLLMTLRDQYIKSGW